MAFLSGSISSYLLFALYTSDLTATMTAGVPPPALSSFQDVLDEGLTVVYVKGTAEEEHLKHHALNLATKKVYEESSIGVNSYEDVEEEISMSNGRVVGFVPTVIPNLGKLRPLLQFENAFQMHIGPSFPIDSDLVDAFKYHLLRLLESGVYDKVYHRRVEESKVRDNSERIFPMVSASPLGYDNLIFPALMLAFGVIVSILSVQMELRSTTTCSYSN